MCCLFLRVFRITAMELDRARLLYCQLWIPLTCPKTSESGGVQSSRRDKGNFRLTAKPLAQQLRAFPTATGATTSRSGRAEIRAIDDQDIDCGKPRSR